MNAMAPGTDRRSAHNTMTRRLAAVVTLSTVVFAALAGSMTPALAAPPVSNSKSTVVASPTSVLADGVATSTITVTLRNRKKQAVAGKTVSVSLASGPGSPTITPPSAVANSSGVAQFTVSSTTAGTDAFKAVDTTDGITLNKLATVTFVPGTPNAGTSTLSASPATVPADGATRSTVTVTLEDVHNNVVPGKSVTLAQVSGTASSTITPTGGVTSAAGTFGFSVFSSTVGTATYQATDTTDGIVVTQTATVTFATGAPSASASTVVASPTSVPDDGTTASTVTVTLVDVYGHPLSGRTISLAQIAGAGAPSITPASGGSNVTNGSGVATFSVTSTTGATDTFQATDSTDGVALNQTVVITFTPNANPDNSTVVASPTSVVADGSTASTITVTLRDTLNHPVSGRTITVTKIAGPGSPSIAPASSGTNVTNGLGIATFTVTSTTAGVDTFEATDTTDAMVLTQDATITFVPGAVSSANSTFTSAPGSVPDDGVSGATLTATLVDAQGNPVPGKAVSAARTSGPGTPVVGPASGPSNAAGVVTFAVTSSTAGTDVFQATDTTDSIVVTQTASVVFLLGAVNQNLSTVVASPTSVPADGTTSTVTVTLVDSTGNAEPGKSVSLAEVAGSAVTIAPATTATTNASGVATFTVSTLTPDVDTFQATDTTDSLVITQTADVTFFGVPTAADSTVVANPTQVAAGPPGSVITVTLNDANVNPVPGKTVTLAQVSGPATAAIGPASGPSAADGTVTFTVTATTLGTDTFQATDTTDSVVVTQTAAVTFVAGSVSSSQSTVAANPTTVFADGVHTSTITVTLVDGLGNRVSGIAVSLAQTAGPGTPVVTGPSPALTDSNGQTTFTVKSTTSGTDTFQATDTTDGITITQTANVTFVAAPTVSAVAPTSGPTIGGTAVTITGTGFQASATVTVGAVAATGVVVVNSTTITAVTGAHAAAGAVDVVVTNPDTQTGTLTGGYTYVELPTTTNRVSTRQYTLSNNNGSTWVEMDQALRISLTPASSRSTVLTGNSDLWTSQAGYNQDMGIFVSIDGGADQPLGWKESGGFAGTFSPNAAYVQTRYDMLVGHTYTFKLEWKANKNAQGATIWAGAGPIAGSYSPTSLMAKTFPAGTVPEFHQVTTQPTLTGSDGATWSALPVSSSTFTPTTGSVAVLGANSDLWTNTAGYNQDLGIFVSVDSGADQLVAWKESGGFAGTFSPNAAFVNATYPMTTGHTYVFKLKWKTNKSAVGSGDSIFAGAGPIGGFFSPTSLLVETDLSGGAAPNASVVNNQPDLVSSNGTTWTAMPGGPTVAMSPLASTNVILGGNADLWTETAGYNQDLGIFVSVDGGADTMVAWKESGGFAGTFSPNAVRAQAEYPTTAGHTYVFRLRWKTNINAPGSTIVDGAGPLPVTGGFSPTRLTAELTS